MKRRGRRIEGFHSGPADVPERYGGDFVGGGRRRVHHAGEMTVAAFELPSNDRVHLIRCVAVHHGEEGINIDATCLSTVKHLTALMLWILTLGWPSERLGMTFTLG